MIKFYGAILVISVTTYLGFKGAAVLGKRTRQLKAWLRIIKIMETEIAYQARVLPEVWQRVAGLSNDEPELKLQFQRLTENLRYDSEKDMQTLWQELIWSQQQTLLKEDLVILQDLGSYLGCTHRQDQVAKLKNCYQALEINLQRAEKKEKQFTGIYRYLGFATGSILVLFTF